MPEIGFGTWALGGRSYGPVGEDDALAALSTAVELGVSVFDTAGIYGDGRSEELLGRALGDVSGARVITKCGYVDEFSGRQDFSTETLRRSVALSRERLRRPTLDVVLLHSPPRLVLEQGRACAALDRIREEGIARETGISLRSTDDWDAAVAWRGCTVVELVLNLLDQRPIDLGIVHDAARRGIKLLARVPLAFGLLSGRHPAGARFAAGDQRSRWPDEQLDAWISASERFRFLERSDRTLAQAALGFAASRPGVWAAIPGMKLNWQVHENVASREIRLDREDLDRIALTWRQVSWLVPRGGVDLDFRGFTRRRTPIAIGVV